MATGDIKWFAGGLHALGNAVHNLGANTIKVGITTSAVTPSPNDSDPRWAAGGSVNFSTDQVSVGGNYANGGPTLSGVSWTIVANVPTLRATDPMISQHASNPTNARWGIIYNDTDANKRALGFIDFGSDRNLTTGDFTMNFGGSGTDVLTLTGT
jgi:hypothetical protein